MKVRRAVTNAVFGGTVVVLLIIAGVGYSLYFTNMHAGQEMTSVMTETVNHTMTVTENMTETMTNTMTATSTSVVSESAIQFAPVSGQMIHSAWVLVQPAGSEYAVSVHAEGLESTQGTGNVYIVEATSSSGSMSMAPIGPNGTSSEFETTSGGVGNFFILLGQNPYNAFESIEIVYLPGMQMSNGTVVATASLTMMMH